jgi:thioredoxin reductase (NADPH)
MRKLVNEGKVLLKTPYVIDSLIGEDSINGVGLKNFETKEIESLECNEIIFLFGLHKKLGPIVDWNLELENNKITVDTEKFESNTAGIFAVGDISDYPGKLNLILSGFHETTLAVRHAFKRCFPEQRVPFRYTTTDTKLQKKLGVIE